METKHTPGPWTIERSNDFDGFHIKGRDGFYPANVMGDCGETVAKANAKLIHAAPDTVRELEAADRVLTSIADMIDEAINVKIRTGRMPNTAALLQTILDTVCQQSIEARAAIAKATGGQS